MKWTVTNAAKEFGVSRETLRKRLTIAEIPTKEHYTTADICAAVFGDINTERLRLVREQADKVALENAAARGELVDARAIRTVVEKGLAAMVAAVQAASNLENEDKEKIIHHLRGVGEGVAGIARPGGGGVGPVSSGGDTSSPLHGEPVGGAVPLPEPGL